MGIGGASEASKNGLSAGWLAGEAVMGVRTVGERSAPADKPPEDVGGASLSARGEETLGACLLEDWLPSREMGKRPLPLPPATVICCALP